VHEYKTKGLVYRRTVQTTLKASYTNHYRRGLIQLLEVLEFRSNNTTHRPVLDALDLVPRHADARLTDSPRGKHVRTHQGLKGDWEALVYRDDERGRRRVVRSVYEVCTFQALRERLRRKEIWVEGADQWRNPDQDLPVDFEERRIEHYAAPRKPLDPTAFIDQLRDELRAELHALDEQLPALDWVEVRDRGKRGPIKLTPLDAAPEPRNLRALKAEIRTRWGTVPLIDMLKEAVLRTGCLVYAYGTGQAEPDLGLAVGIGVVAFHGHLRAVPDRALDHRVEQADQHREAVPAAAGDPNAFPRLAAALTRPIRWDVIAEQYDQMIRYATAIRAGTASTEAILRRFRQANAIHPTYQAMIETGRAPEDPVRRPVSARPGPAARDQRGPERGRVLEPRQLDHLLRQGRRHRDQPP
jgi:hypothetical protein